MKYLTTYKIFELGTKYHSDEHLPKPLSDSDIKDIFEVLSDVYYEDINIECYINDDNHSSRNQIRAVFWHLGNDAIDCIEDRNEMSPEMYIDLYKMLSPKLEILKDYGISPNSICYFYSDRKRTHGRGFNQSAFVVEKNLLSSIKGNLNVLWVVFNVNRAR
jgi:hypothetical protein